VPASTRTSRAAGRSSSPRRPALLALVLAAVLLLGPGAAAALVVYGPPRALRGDGGCLRDPSELSPPGQSCPGAAAGLAGAEAVAVSPDGGSVYVAAGEDLVELARDRTTGALRPALSPSTFSCIGARPDSPCATKDASLSGADAVAVSPDSRFVYVGSSNTATVGAFHRGRNGVLLPLARSLRGPKRSTYSGCLAGIPLAGIPQSSCAGRVLALNGVDALAMSPDGRELYAVSSGLEPGKDSLVTLQRDPRSGGLRPLQETPGCVQSLPGSGCPALAGLEGASAITISPDGRFVYVASEVSGAVRGFKRNRTAGVLTPLLGRGGCVSSGNRADDDVSCEEKAPQLAGARSLAVSPDGRELYVAAFDPGAVVVLGRNPRSGVLGVRRSDCLQVASDANCPTGLIFLRGAAALAVGPHGGFVDVVSEGGNSLVELLRDPISGTLTPASEVPLAEDPLSGPVAIALPLRGGNVYVVSPYEGVGVLTG
jgi:6-phosphogluconolactonase (cycloisomerase 2 family)